MKKLSNLIKFSSNRKLGFRVQLFGRDFFPWIKNQGLGQMTRFLYFSLDFCHFFIKIMCFSSNFCPCSSFAGVQGLAFLSSSFRGLAFRSSISTSINVLKKMSKKLKKSSKNGGTALILVFGTVLFLVFLRCMQDYKCNQKMKELPTAEYCLARTISPDPIASPTKVVLVVPNHKKMYTETMVQYIFTSF